MAAKELKAKKRKALEAKKEVKKEVTKEVVQNQSDESDQVIKLLFF